MNCIEYDGTRSPKGYCRRRVNGRQDLAHRWAYAEHHGISIDSLRGKVVRHTCDNPPCVNPAHLVLGTHADNMQDKADRSRVRGERNPNVVLTDAQVVEIRTRYVPRCRDNGCRALAREYGVTSCTISNIVNHKSREIL